MSQTSDIRNGKRHPQTDAAQVKETAPTKHGTGYEMPCAYDTESGKRVVKTRVLNYAELAQRCEELEASLHEMLGELAETISDASEATKREKALRAENESLRELFYDAWDWMQRARHDGSIRDDEMDALGTRAVKELGFPDYELGIETDA